MVHNLESAILRLLEPRVIIEFGPDGTPRHWSDGAPALFDYSPEEFASLSFESLFHWERIGKRPAQLMEEMRQEGEPIRELELPAVRKGEVTFPALVSFIMEEDGVVALVEDTSESLRRIRALEEERRRLEVELSALSLKLRSVEDDLTGTRDQLLRLRKRMEIYSRLISYVGSIWEEEFLISGVLDLLVLLEVTNAATFHIYDEDRGMMVLKGAVGVREDALPREHDTSEGIWQSLMQHKKSILLRNERETFSVATPMGMWAPAALLAFPLEYHGIFIGALTIAMDHVPDEEERTFYESLFTHVAIAIYNIRQYANLRDMASKLHDQAKEIEEKNRLLEEASRRRTVFISNMTHELRTPLNIILGFTEVLEETLGDRVDEGTAQILKEIRSAGQHLLGIVEDILALSKIETGDLSLVPQVASVNEFFGTLLESWKEKAHNVEVGYDYTLPEEDHMAELDFIKIRQALNALLANALKFTPVGGTVRVDVSVDGEDLHIVVSDTGVGIPKEELDEIFEPFRQGRAGLEKPMGGTGIGLTLARHYVRLHGGSLTVESEEGKGSKFSIHLPGVIVN